MSAKDRIKLASRPYYQCVGECGYESYDFRVFDAAELYWDEGSPDRREGWRCELCLDGRGLATTGRETLADAMNETRS